ncbi:MAG: (2Fe-2S)-binding protein [Pseudomonadota bacterium]
MIVCHCNVIAKDEIVAVIHDFLDDDPWQLIVPLKVYHALEKRGKCCGCFPNVIGIIIEVVTAYHENSLTPEAEIICIIDRIRREHELREAEDRERRRTNRQKRTGQAA